MAVNIDDFKMDIDSLPVLGSGSGNIISLVKSGDMGTVKSAMIAKQNALIDDAVKLETGNYMAGLRTAV